ncbi:MAG: hypothetical protein Q7R81_02610 [Candidatus Peregrinibacteria bacterium]|nr:hypothetical protein [Candidatus Peregrinibacteria bacterium]
MKLFAKNKTQALLAGGLGVFTLAIISLHAYQVQDLSLTAQVPTACFNTVDDDGDGKVDAWKIVKSKSVVPGDESGSVGVISGDYAYYGTSSITPSIVKWRLSTFTKVATLALDADATNDGFMDAALLSEDGQTAFFSFQLGKVIPIDLTTFTQKPPISVPVPESGYGATPLAVRGNYLYVGTAGGVSVPGIITRVDLSGSTPNAVLYLNEGESMLPFGFVLDGQSLFIGTGDSPAQLVKINLETFTRENAISLGIASAIHSGIRSGNFGYFLGNGSLAKVDLVNFKTVKVKTISWKITNIGGLLLDPLGTYGYFTENRTDSTPAKIHAVRLSDLSLTKAVAFAKNESELGGALIDTVRDALYVHPAKYTSVRLVKIALNDRECVNKNDISEAN